MSADTTKRGFLGSVATAGLFGLTGCLGATPLVDNRDEETRTIPLEDANSIAIYGTTGRVAVTGTDRDDVRLEIVKESNSVRTDLDDLSLETDRTDGRLEVRSSWDGSEGWLAGRPSMDLDVEIPREVALERVETSTGRIDIADVEGTVSAAASTGRVEISRPERLGDVTTSTGRIEVEVPAIDGETTIEASTGRVTAAVSEALDADLTVETGTGRIEVDDPLSDALADATHNDDRVTGRLGDGGPSLRIETSTGRVTVGALE